MHHHNVQQPVLLQSFEFEKTFPQNQSNNIKYSTIEETCCPFLSSPSSSPSLSMNLWVGNFYLNSIKIISHGELHYFLPKTLSKEASFLCLLEAAVNTLEHPCWVLNFGQVLCAMDQSPGAFLAFDYCCCAHSNGGNIPMGAGRMCTRKEHIKSSTLWWGCWRLVIRQYEAKSISV